MSGQAGIDGAAVRVKRGKAGCALHYKLLEHIPNIGPAMAADLRLMGINEPHQLQGEDALGLHQNLCRMTNQRHDSCVLDTFTAAVDFMNGAKPTPWRNYTAERKARFGNV